MTLPIWRDTVFSIRGGEENQYTGTGFLVHCDTQAAYVVTCAHVVQNIGESEIMVDGFPAKLISSLTPVVIATDLAVLSVVELRDKQPLPSRRVPDEEGKSFWTYGFDKELRARELQGTFQKQSPKWIAQGIKVTGLDLKITEDDYSLEGGYSGSPVVDDSNFVVAVIQELVGDGKRGRAISVEALVHVWPHMPDNLLEQGKVGTIENKTDRPRSNDVARNSQERAVLRLRGLEPASNPTVPPRLADAGENIPGKTLPQSRAQQMMQEYLLHHQPVVPEPAIIQTDPSHSEDVVGNPPGKVLQPLPERQTASPRPAGAGDSSLGNALPQSGSSQKKEPRPAIANTQKAARALFFIVFIGGLISFIFDIIQARLGLSPAWWIWTCSIIGGFVGLIYAVAISDMPQEQFIKYLDGIVTALTVIYYILIVFMLSGVTALIIDIVKASQGSSPVWWVWAISISIFVLGFLWFLPYSLSEGIKQELESSK